jgi:hypothetical protein
MASRKCDRDAAQYSLNPLRNERGVALVIALLFSMSIMALVTGVLYYVTQATTMSGAGKRYATAEEVADGAVNVVKDSINLAIWGENIAGLFSGADAVCLTDAILNENGVCENISLTLPGVLDGQNFQARVTVERLYSVSLPGSRLEFAKSAGGVSSTAIYFRISVVVTGPGSAQAENSALYRFAG